MRSGNVEYGAAAGEMPGHAGSDHDPVRRFFAVLPRPLRFLGVGGLGLITDLAVFTLIIAQTPHPLLARLASLAIATLVLCVAALISVLVIARNIRRQSTVDEARPADVILVLGAAE